MRRFVLPAVIVLCAGSAGCSEADGSTAEPGAQTAVDTVNGVAHVRSTGEAAAWQATPVARIGSADGGPAGFGRVRSLIADEAGNVYVADNLSNEIRVFGPTGQYLSTIGRKGRGPGELGDLYSLAWLGSNLAAMDPRNARIGVFTRDGKWVEGIRYFPITGPPMLIRFHPLGDAGFYAPVISSNGGLPFVRFTAAGPMDTISLPSAPATARDYGMLCNRADGGITGISISDAPTLTWAFPSAGGGIAAAWTETYRIVTLGPAGDTLRVLDREGTEVPYPDSVWAEAEGEHRELIRDYPGTKCEPASLERPAARAALRSMTFDDAGRMWVEAATAEGFAWDVFDSDGRLLGRAPAPRRSTAVPPYVRGDLLYQVETDSLDVQSVAVYRVGPKS